MHAHVCSGWQPHACASPARWPQWGAKGHGNCAEMVGGAEMAGGRRGKRRAVWMLMRPWATEAVWPLLLG